MTARDITLGLSLSRYHKNFVLPRYTPKGWWECDLMEVRPSGYMCEYEIKVSRADFKADAKKQASLGWWAHKHGIKGKLKHKQLAAGDPSGPVQFWYVVPRGLVDVEEVPPFAGLIEVSEHGSGAWAARGYITERERKEAPRLHSTKLDPKVISHARGVCYWRLQKTMAQNWRLGRVEVRNTQLLRAFGWPKQKPQKVENSA